MNEKNENKFYIHANCCNNPWKLIFSLNYYLICPYCGKISLKIIERIDESFFLMDPCSCGCGNYTLYPLCCRNLQHRIHWELTYYLNLGTIFIEYEQYRERFELCASSIT